MNTANGLKPGAAMERAVVPRVRAFLWRNGGAAIVRWTPYPAYRLRSAILRLFGAKVGSGVRWRRTARLDMPWQLELGDLSMVGDRVWIAGDAPVSIGARTTVSQGTTLLTTRADRPSTPEVQRGAIEIGSDAWIAADVMLMPGVRIGQGCVVGARSLVQSDLPEYEVAVGHPARTLGRRRLKSIAP